jgi:hypothetical protein
MSDFAIRERWKKSGSLRFLAAELGKTSKQVTRYWDLGLIPGIYRTSGGHRRIEYGNDTVNHVRLVLQARNRKNILIRYHWKQVDYLGTIIPLSDCNTVDQLYERALHAGLSEGDARYLAYSPEPEEEPRNFNDDVWDISCAEERILETGPAEALRALPTLFKTASARGQWDARSLGSLDFVDRTAATFLRIHGKVLSPRLPLSQIRLNAMAAQLKRRQRPPTAAALAASMNLGRSALYRKFGTQGVRSALRTILTDTAGAGQGGHAGTKRT